MTCDVCKRDGCGDPGCAALKVMAELQAMSEAEYGVDVPWVRSEREQLAWDFRRQWHAVRGKAFLEPPPKSYAEIECERAFAKVTAR